MTATGTPVNDVETAGDGAGGGRLVLLVHGIRTQAEWQGMVVRTLEDDSTVIVPLKYGYFDALRFWCPVWTRKKAIGRLLWRVEDAIQKHPRRDLTILAHSFGTYAITQILRQKPGIQPSRVILCGSIVKRNFRWDQLPNRPDVLNDCGTRDIWPVLAESSTWGYGASGTFGFGSPGVEDRFHQAGHSAYFDEEFVRDYWKPWIQGGQIVRSPHERKRSTTSWWRSILTVAQIKYLALLAVLFYVVYSVVSSRLCGTLPKPDIDRTGARWTSVSCAEPRSIPADLQWVKRDPDTWHWVCGGCGNQQHPFEGHPDSLTLRQNLRASRERLAAGGREPSNDYHAFVSPVYPGSTKPVSASVADNLRALVFLMAIDAAQPTQSRWIALRDFDATASAMRRSGTGKELALETLRYMAFIFPLTDEDNLKIKDATFNEICHLNW